MTKSYTTISGDMWDKIAFEQMGSVLHTDKLMKANAKYASTYVFPAGVVLTIPEVEDEEDLELPPWKRGLLTLNERKRHGTPGGTAVEISKCKSPGKYK